MKTSATTLNNMPGLITVSTGEEIHQNILPRKSTEFVVIIE